MISAKLALSWLYSFPLDPEIFLIKEGQRTIQIAGLYAMKEKYWNTLGRCYEFSFGQKLTLLDPMEVRLNSTENTPFYVHLHPPGQFYNKDTRGTSNINGYFMSFGVSGRNFDPKSKR